MSSEEGRQTLLFWDPSNWCHESWSHWKRLGWKQQIWGRLYLAIARTKTKVCWNLMMNGPFDTSNLLFLPTNLQNNIPSYPTKQNLQTHNLLFIYMNWIPTKQTQVFPLDIRTQTHHKRASNGHCGERCTRLPMEKSIRQRRLPCGFPQHCGVATGSCNAPAWSRGTELGSSCGTENLRKLKLHVKGQDRIQSSRSIKLSVYWICFFNANPSHETNSLKMSQGFSTLLLKTSIHSKKKQGRARTLWKQNHFQEQSREEMIGTLFKLAQSLVS